MNEPCHLWMSHVIYEWAMSFINEPCHLCGILGLPIRRKTPQNAESSEKVRLCGFVSFRMSHGTNMHESWHKYEWVMSHMWVSNGTHMNESCHTRHTGTYGRHDSFIRVPWLIRMCAMTHSYVQHDSQDMQPHMGDMTHSYVCHDSFVCVPWLIHTCAMTHKTYSHLYRISPYMGWLRWAGSWKL